MERRQQGLQRAVICACVAAFGLPGHAVSAGTDGGSCPAAVGKDFPPASAAEAGPYAEALLRLNAALDEGSHDVRSLLVVRDCKLVFERYREGIGRDHNHSLYSVTKSISATLVGALLVQGKLKSIDVPVSEVISRPSSFREDDWSKARRISLKNVMQMSSGLAYKHDPSNHPIYSLSVDRFAVALSPEFVAEPGARYQYSDGDASITGAVVAAAADSSLYGFARAALFDPLQMSNHDWAFMDKAGRYPGGWGLRLRPMDMAKIGQLYLQNGVWNGHTIFAPVFRDLAWAPGVNKLYALHWWIGSALEAKDVPYFFAAGFKGQRIYVFPKLRLVAVLTSSLPGVEERKVTGLIVGALVTASGRTSTANQAETLAALAALQSRGFRGETRVLQSDQDRPR